MSDYTSNTRAVGFKPCPFCGNIALDLDSRELFTRLQDANYELGAALSIGCEVCNMEMWERTSVETDYDKRVALLRDKWNRRAEQ